MAVYKEWILMKQEGDVVWIYLAQDKNWRGVFEHDSEK
jgi:hypothetical protein